MMYFNVCTYFFQFYRCFLSAGQPSCSPSKSRVVEAILIHLCDSITQPLRQPRYVSRFKRVLSHYHSIQARLFNSHALLERTNLMLYSINEAGITKWFKNTTRRDEIKLLMQGLTLQTQPSVASDPLPPPQSQPKSSQPPLQPHIFVEPQDTTGQAKVRASKGTASMLRTMPGPSGLSPNVPGPIGLLPNLPGLTPNIPGLTSFSSQMPGLASFLPGATSSFSHMPGLVGLGLTGFSSNMPGLTGSSPNMPGPSSVNTEPMTRTSAWRHRKEKEEGKETKIRKTYNCRICGKPMKSEGHTQFRGQRYCPEAPGQIPKEEWLAMKSKEAEAKPK